MTQKTNNKYRIFTPRRILLLLLLIAVLAFQFVAGAGEFYALRIYPAISLALSWASSFISFSLEEWIVVAAILLLIAFPLISRRRGNGWRNIIISEIEIVVWIFVWFYLGWGCNYFRSSLLNRMQIKPEKVDKAVFQEFLREYTDSLNASYVQISSVDQESALKEIKSVYDKLPEQYGLSKPKSFQQPKKLLFNGLYSGAGVLGFMGPFASESQVIENLLPVQYPFVLAHETSHLLGVSNEAEANYWGYYICTKAKDPAIRYCGYFGILSNVMNNAFLVLTKEEKDEWMKTIDPRIMRDIQRVRERMIALRNPIVDDVQNTIYNWFLKGNKISSGTENYNQVVGLIIAIKKAKKGED